MQKDGVQQPQKPMDVSVIMPLFNAEQFLPGALKSLVEQTLGMDRMQVILVNDGSYDKTEEICRAFCETYPDNTLYLKKENGGAADARNLGLDHVKGRYVAFLDGDDYWEKEALLRGVDFFDAHYEKIDLLACRIINFGNKKEKTHPLDYKYTGDRIIDIEEEPTAVQSTIGNVICKAEAIEDLRFDTSMPVGEDGLFVNTLLLEKACYGVMATARYYYRRQKDGSSLSASHRGSSFFFMELPKKLDLALIELSQSRYGRVLPYVQHFCMYELKWRFIKRNYHALHRREIEEYQITLQQILLAIDDDLLINALGKDDYHKLSYLWMKYGKELTEHLDVEEQTGCILFDSTPLQGIDAWGRCTVTLMERRGETLHVEGVTDCGLFDGKLTLHVRDNHGREYPLESSEYVPPQLNGILEELLCMRSRFVVDLPFAAGQNYQFFVKMEGQPHHSLPYVSFGKFAPMVFQRDAKFKAPYVKMGKCILTYQKERGLEIQKSSLPARIKREVAYQRTCLSQKRIGTILYRNWYYLAKPFHRKPIWLISDRYHKGGDNGEALFTHIMKTDVAKTHDVYFVFNKSNKVDYERLKGIGKVIDHNARHYKLYYLMADMIISSHADEELVNPFFNGLPFLKNIIKRKFVYLQHGVTPGDLSAWLNKLSKNISLMMAVSPKEYDFLVNSNYLYDEHVIKLTGAPRLDEIDDTPKGIVAILPTWRSHLSGAYDPVTRTRQYNPAFKESTYYKFYQALINDERIIKAMKKHHLKGEFFNHPSFVVQEKDFTGNDTIKVGHGIADYNRLISESNLFITDYSSVTFDFAYLRKSIIYTHFDEDEFWAGHTYAEGYFQYERDGFGPVYRDYESTVAGIVAAIERNCQNPDVYRQRCDTFFAYYDKENSKRALEEILQLERGQN